MSTFSKKSFQNVFPKFFKEIPRIGMKKPGKKEKKGDEVYIEWKMRESRVRWQHL